MTDAQVEEIKRHFGVVAEALRSDIRQIAEGHSGIRHELQEMREKFRDEFKEMRALMRLSFHNSINESAHSKQIFLHSSLEWTASKPTASNPYQLQ